MCSYPIYLLHQLTAADTRGMSRRALAKKKRQTIVTVPERASPHVKLVFAEMHRQNLTYDEVEEGSGVIRATLKAWRHKNYPSLDGLEAVLGFLGYDYMPMPRRKTLPPKLVDRLQPIADEMALTLPQVTQALVAILAGVPASSGRRQHLTKSRPVLKQPASIHSDGSKLIQDAA